MRREVVTQAVRNVLRAREGRAGQNDQKLVATVTALRVGDAQLSR
jgi:hypothetical protein